MHRIIPDLLTAKEVSKILRVHTRTVQRLSKQGKLKAIKIGDQWRYRKSDIEEYREFGIDFSRKPDTGNERRSYSRINTYLNCNYLINLSPVKSLSDSGIIRNLGANGIFLLAPIDSIEIDDPIDLSFTIVTDENQKFEIKTRARVIRKSQNGVGIKFRNVKKEIKDRIIDYVG